MFHVTSASLYVRLSRAATESNLSLEGMVSDLRGQAESLNYEVRAVHVDDGLSGAIRDRPQFVAWLDDARTGRADALFAFHGDRITREGVNAAAMVLDVIEGKDPTTGAVVRTPVRFVSYDGLDSERDAEAFRWRFVIAAEIARGERERMKARSSDSRRRLALAGRWPGGRVPYGYQVSEKEPGKKTLIHHPAEADAVRRAARQVLAGVPLGRVARRMTTEGVATRGLTRGAEGGEWTRVSLRQVLSGEAVLGRVTYQGSVVRDDDGHPLVAWEPILDVETSLALRQMFADAKQIAPKGRAPARLLSGVLVCAGCGRKMNVGGPLLSRKYHCSSYGDMHTCPAPTTVRADQVDEYVEARFLASFGNLPTFERVVKAGTPTGLAEVEDRIAALTASLAEAATAETFTRLQAAQVERDELRALPATPTETLAATGRTCKEEWATGDLPRRRELLTDAYAHIAVLPIGRGRRVPPEERLDIVEFPGDNPAYFDD